MLQAELISDKNYVNIDKQPINKYTKNNKNSKTKSSLNI